MNIKDVENRKFLKEQQFKEAKKNDFDKMRRPFKSHSDKARLEWFKFSSNSLEHRLCRALNKFICQYLDDERVNMSAEQREDISRRDWEGQDNMK